ncbi:Oidioi.mRNA.OKI2018_I69.PAR.g10050.t1.cds [Oikopleura dioica]|uniref:Oidioi.mRNA.OKI2018_I69.PAR.g10050.t1.cds n=1 Tax=Oikopleura dioica TaxID=34765 RepID=A0ABN7RTZ6_OIKDI|nr:Oidioi.mRNA.OKI2018_I69.PAR.g10050.t1.cds [Oikopleura dioica]
MEIPAESIEKIVGDMDKMFTSSLSGYKEIKEEFAKSQIVLPEICANMNSFKNVAQCGQSFVEDVYASGIKTLINVFGESYSVEESLNNLNANFDQLIEELGGENLVDEKTKMKIEKAKMVVSSLVDFNIEDKNLFAGIPSSLIKIDDIIWESAEESVQITDALLEEWSGRYSSAARKLFDICRENDEEIPKYLLAKCGRKLMKDLKINQKTSLIIDFLKFSFDEFDDDRNGKLDFEKFEKIFANFIATAGSTMIKIFDRNEDGIIDKAETNKILKELGKLSVFQGDYLSGSYSNFYLHPTADLISSFLVSTKQTISKSEMTNMTAKVMTRLASDYYDLQVSDWEARNK